MMSSRSFMTTRLIPLKNFKLVVCSSVRRELHMLMAQTEKAKPWFYKKEPHKKIQICRDQENLTLYSVRVFYFPRL